MSTRSGKRIHSSFHENIITTESELAIKSERKTRSKRLKENNDHLDTNVAKMKKRHNYVSYPAEDEPEPLGDIICDDTEAKNVRKKRRNTLKDHNITVSTVEVVESFEDNKKAVRLTRRTKVAENEEHSNVLTEAEIPNGMLGNEKKSKKSKKNKKRSTSSIENKLQNGDVEAPAKKSKKKKKQKKSDSLNDVVKNNGLNKSGMSIDSFHSAAGSPAKEDEGAVDGEGAYIPIEKTYSQTLDEYVEKNSLIEPVINTTCDKEVKKRNSSIKVDSKLDGTFDKNASTNDPVLNGTWLKEPKPKIKSSMKNATFDKNENVSLLSPQGPNSMFDKTESNMEKRNSTFTSNLGPNCTFDKTESNKLKLDSSFASNLGPNSTFDKTEANIEKLNSTFEIEPTRKSLRLSSAKKDSTFEKTESKPTSLNNTYDKDTKKPDSTFDKSESQNKTGSLKSSLASSEDGTINVTFDKSDENIRVSITSDDSTGNIVNTTPVLIESSMDESQITRSPKQSLKTDSVPEMAEKTIPPMTPLKREGTFTKDGPDAIIMSPKPKISSEKTLINTPKKRMSLPSPGSTPFPTRSSQKSVLNVTRSIEKSRRSSLAEMVPRQTKVMFCSPENNPVLVMQQKKTIIKSSMKGSNKSFIFDDSVTSTTKPAARKRSFTHNDAEDTRIKRKRLADDMQQSVDRLSRPRTFSATAKLDTTNPQKKPATPYKQKSESKPSRTKLPNFAALHTKEFDKMESLNEFKERKAKRAKQLLTPTGAVGSPRVTTEAKPKEPAKKNETPFKRKPETVFKPKQLTLESLRPGYTRFGFKMDCDVNPFSIPSKVDIKPKEIKPNGITKPLPSLAGATSMRREVAKNTVLREKSFTSLSGKRDEKRKENRTIIKGVRTNRRFELQMRSRNMN